MSVQDFSLALHVLLGVYTNRRREKGDTSELVNRFLALITPWLETPTTADEDLIAPEHRKAIADRYLKAKEKFSFGRTNERSMIQVGLLSYFIGLLCAALGKTEWGKDPSFHALVGEAMLSLVAEDLKA